MHFSLECFALELIGTESHTPPSFCGFGCALRCGKGCVWQKVGRPVCQMTSNCCGQYVKGGAITSRWTVAALGVHRQCHQSSMRHWELYSFRRTEEVMMGLVWELICPLVSPDDVVKSRTAARCWNGRQIRSAFFSMLKMDQFVRHGHSEIPADKRELTRLNNFVSSGSLSRLGGHVEVRLPDEFRLEK